MGAVYKAAGTLNFGAGNGRRGRPMLVAVAAAAALHALLLLGVGFKLPEPTPADRGILEVMLVTRAATSPRSPAPDSVMAQADRAGDTSVPLQELDEPQPDRSMTEDGSGLDDVPHTEPLTEPPQPEPELEPEREPEPQQEADSRQEPAPPIAPELLPEPEPQPPEVLTAEASPVAAETTPPVSAADILASRNDEIARLTERIDAQTRAYQSRARRKAVSTSTREYRYAAYMEGWRRKVERIGNLNYPQEARDQGLYGNLILHVAVRADGTLEGVRVVRSSGQEVLDQAAIRIVELAAPFAEFPADIAAETDILDITRTWQFQRNNRLGWDN